MTNENDHGAGLIHQAIPDVVGTEPRPNRDREVVTRLFDMWEEVERLTRTSVSDQRGAYLHVLGKLNYVMLPVAVDVKCCREFGRCETPIMCVRNQVCTYAPASPSPVLSAQSEESEAQ